MERQRYCWSGARQSDEHECKLKRKSMQTQFERAKRHGKAYRYERDAKKNSHRPNK